MNTFDIYNKLKSKYNWAFNKQAEKIILINFDEKIKFYIGKILFSDNDFVGIRLLNSSLNIIYNYTEQKMNSTNMKNVIIINPLNNNLDNCELCIGKLIDEINNLNSSINSNNFYSFKYSN